MQACVQGAPHHMLTEASPNACAQAHSRLPKGKHYNRRPALKRQEWPNDSVTTRLTSVQHTVSKQRAGQHTSTCVHKPLPCTRQSTCRDVARTHWLGVTACSTALNHITPAPQRFQNVPNSSRDPWPPPSISSPTSEGSLPDFLLSVTPLLRPELGRWDCLPREVCISLSSSSSIPGDGGPASSGIWNSSSGPMGSGAATERMVRDWEGL